MPGLAASTVIEQKEKVMLRADDVFVCTYPKCGTTWMQQLLKLITSNGVETGVDLDVFAPWIELMTIDEIEAMPSPRFFKTHLPYHLMAGGGDPASAKPKYIYVIRNPKDAAVSRYHFLKKLEPSLSSLTWEAFFWQYLNGDVSYGAFYSHLLGWWSHKDSLNILILSFEEMKRNPSVAVKRVVSFLGRSLSDEVIEKVIEHTNFDNMKSNSAANKAYMDPYTPGKNPFMRKGIVGDWKTMFTKEQSAEMDQLLAAKLGATGLIFDFGD